MKYTIPAFNPSDIPASIVTVSPALVLRGLRVTGDNLIFVHTVPPTTSAQHLDGWPLGPNATTPLLGEALPLSMSSGSLAKLYVTAIAASEIRTLDIS